MFTTGTQVSKTTNGARPELRPKVANEIRELEQRIFEASPWVESIHREMGKVIVGQRSLVDRLLLGLLTNGHILLEGVPGLAKTLALKTLAGCMYEAQFGRIQFTPDMLPSDITGTTIYHAPTSTFEIKLGPIFANLILADEVNRAPAKVQSALLEAMQERQVTLGGESFTLPDPFLVLATQNPLEQEGTYPLPEAQTPGATSSSIYLSDELRKQCAITAIASKSEAPKFAFDESAITQEDRDVLAVVAKCLTTGPLKGKTVRSVREARRAGNRGRGCVVGGRATEPRRSPQTRASAVRCGPPLSLPPARLVLRHDCFHRTRR